MELQGFLDAVRGLSYDDVRALAVDIDGLTTTTADEIEVTRAFLHIEAVLRQQRRVREACLAGHRASELVVGIARRAGAELPDTAVTRVARWADTVARGIVAQAAARADLEVLGHACDHIDALAPLTLSLVDDPTGESSGKPTVVSVAVEAAR